MSRSAYQPLKISVFFWGGNNKTSTQKNFKRVFVIFIKTKSHKSGEVDWQICSSPKSGEVDRHFCPSYSRWAYLPLLRISLYCVILKH